MKDFSLALEMYVYLVSLLMARQAYQRICLSLGKLVRLFSRLLWSVAIAFATEDNSRAIARGEGSVSF